MNLLRKLFGGTPEDTAEKQREEQARHFDILKYDGVRALKSGQPAYAVECLRRALDIKEDLECRDYLSQALIHEGDLTAAYDQLQKLAEAQPDNQHVYLRMATVAYMMENYTAMAEACEKAMLIDAENPQVMYSYARACLGQGDTVNAVAMLTKAISLKDDYAEARLLRGETLRKTGDIEAADEDADWLLAHGAADEDALLLKARLLEARGLHTDAIRRYDEALAANPFCTAAYDERGHIRLALGDTAGGQSDLNQARETASEPSARGENTDGDIQQKVEQAYRNNNPLGL